MGHRTSRRRGSLVHGVVQEDPLTANRVEEAIDMLAREGPRLGRPLVDRIKGSKWHNLKELRPASAGSTEIRILFVFDPVRCAVLLVAGDKAGGWKRWYDVNIPIAEERYRQHLRNREEG
jgi:hypothetical protein